MTTFKKRQRPTQIQKPVSQTPMPKPIELTEEDLAAIAGGGILLNHNETIASPVESVKLSEADLDAIAGVIDNEL